MFGCLYYSLARFVFALSHLMRPGSRLHLVAAYHNGPGSLLGSGTECVSVLYLVTGTVRVQVSV